NFNLHRRASPRPYRPGNRAEFEALFEFVRANQDTLPAGVMCRLLGVSLSGFYSWRTRALSAHARRDIELAALIHGIYERSHRTYGSRRVHAELREAFGVHVGRKRV